MDRLKGVGPVLAVLALAALLASACASRSPGTYHTVRSGENLYRIGLRYGVPADAIARANRIDDPTDMAVGTRLWIPRSSGRRASARPPPAPPAKSETRPAGGSGMQCVWPVRGQVTSAYGKRGGRMHEGIDIAARSGTTIRACNAGKVIFAGRLGGYGKMVIIKHAGHYRSVYAHASRLHVRVGQFVERGQKIASVGSTGRASGPHLHFEIRRGESPTDPVRYLP